MCSDHVVSMIVTPSELTSAASCTPPGKFEATPGATIADATGDGAFEPVAEAVGPSGARPYDLRHSFVRLLIHESRSVIEVAAQAAIHPRSHSRPTRT